MMSKKYTAFVALAVCTLALAAIGSVKNPVKRPLKGTGFVTVTFHADVAKGIVTAETIDVGQATHTGLCCSHATATGSLADAAQGFLPSPDTGTNTAANGDQVFWKIIPGSNWACSITGATGRFEGCYGGMNYLYQSPMVVSYPDAYTIVVTWTEEYEGSITY
jgi:hypothetical protein